MFVEPEFLRKSGNFIPEPAMLEVCERSAEPGFPNSSHVFNALP